MYIAVYSYKQEAFGLLRLDPYLGKIHVPVISTFTVFTLILAHAFIIAQLLVWKSKNGNFLMIFWKF